MSIRLHCEDVKSLQANALSLFSCSKVRDPNFRYWRVILTSCSWMAVSLVRAPLCPSDWEDTDNLCRLQHTSWRSVSDTADT